MIGKVLYILSLTMVREKHVQWRTVRRTCSDVGKQEKPKKVIHEVEQVKYIYLHILYIFIFIYYIYTSYFHDIRNIVHCHRSQMPKIKGSLPQPKLKNGSADT